MNEVFLLLLPVVGVFAIGCTIALLSLGKIIDGFPVGDESKRERSLASPVESTRISVILFWALFIIGIWALFLETRFGLILGITTLAAACLFMFTALVFSFAVLSTMRRKKELREIPVIQVGTADEIITISKETYDRPLVTSRKRQNNFLTGIMMSTMSKKE